MSRSALHLRSFLLFLTALLYGGVVAGATDAIQPSPVQSSVDPTIAPHIALLLPTGSDAFARHAEAVRSGFIEAHKRLTPKPPPVRLYPVNDDPRNVLTAYRQALAAGAQIVVGPLTRNGVTALAGAVDLVKVPTLVLNVPDRTAARPANLYTLSLQVEGEARQVARLAAKDGRRKALTVSDGTAFGQRMREAFVDEFKRGGGHHIADYPYPGDGPALERLRQAASIGVADMMFLAVDAGRSRTLRSVATTLAAYGTSQLNPGSAAGGGDVPDVRFVDMPWMVQRDHAAVMVFSRAGPRLADDLERLYALGIDAFRIANELLAGNRAIDLDGVTGRLTLARNGEFRRSLLVIFVNGGKASIVGEVGP